MAEYSRSEITSSFNSGLTEIVKEVRRLTNNDNTLIGKALGMKIDERVDFNDLNYQFMRRFMMVNINEHNSTMMMLGQDAHFNGDSTSITGQAIRPSYADGVNYVRNFASRVSGDESIGQNTTRTSELTSTYNPYKEVKNLYPDDLDSGEFTNKWKLTNENSILTKTKKLFAAGKINTLISRFSQFESGHVSSDINANTKYGMSHGRNLLKKGAEDGNIPYDVHGYNNPYCRVWTHHYQYDKLNKLIRPFLRVTADGTEITESLSDFHTFDNFKETGYNADGLLYLNSLLKNGNNLNIMDTHESKRWKDGNAGWDKSVLDSNGFVKIAPKYLGGGEKNIHTKDCMFSIENLAWRGYDPYSFDKALSWEQRGPLGGRIMWFPPYGLTFNETTQANWNSSTFIGRGEDVYTYVNTVRSGTLSFIMLTDHPSIVDYATFDDPDDTILKDTDILRFFAGCDFETLKNAAKPTPLTDEPIGMTKTETEIVTPEKLPEEKETKESVPDKVETAVFYVFFPNNYAGHYDMPTNPSPVNAIGYL